METSRENAEHVSVMVMRLARPRAFTVLELLVVTAIIAVLSAVAFPVMQHARGAAARTQCITNLREIGVAFSSYLDDNENIYPAAYNEWLTPAYERRSGHTPGIIEALTPYGAVAPLWRCPSDTGLNLNFSDYWIPSANRPYWLDNGSSYYYRDMDDLVREPAYPDPHNPALATRPASAVRLPSEYILCIEIMPWHARPGAPVSYWTYGGPGVALFCDGHVGVQPWHELRANMDRGPSEE